MKRIMRILGAVLLTPIIIFTLTLAWCDMDMELWKFLKNAYSGKWDKI